jgi:paraquat-inducible protein A
LSQAFRFALLAIAAALLVLGISMPMIRFDQFYFFSDELSLLALISGLWSHGDLLLACMVALFSVILPMAKLVMLGVESFSPGGRGGIFRRAMPHLARWSMMDVMLVAIVIFAAKTSGLADASALPGLWFYAAAAIMTAVLPSVVKLERNGRPSEGP